MNRSKGVDCPLIVKHEHGRHQSVRVRQKTRFYLERRELELKISGEPVV